MDEWMDGMDGRKSMGCTIVKKLRVSEDMIDR